MEIVESSFVHIYLVFVKKSKKRGKIMKFVDLFDWENRPLCRRISIFIYACLWIGTYAFIFSLLG